MKDLILAIDQGTTGSTALILDASLQVLGRANQEYRQIYPKPGWVEHDPEDIWNSVLKAIEAALRSASPAISADRIATIGITNQRETTLLWEEHETRPVHNAIVWQCRRTADLCERLKRRGHERTFRRKTGLVLDAYFSGTKLLWLLETFPEFAAKARKGALRAGTVDSFLVARLTRGEAHVTDVSNASRTLLMNLKTLDWDPELLKILKIPPQILPRIVGNSEEYGHTRGVPGLPDGIPITGMAGDQQAALFGQACFEPGEAKCTYGTGAFMLINTGTKCIPSKTGMLTTVGWKLGNRVTYALEGSTFIAGAAVQWLRDGLGILQKSSDVESLALSVEDSGGVTFVPAFVGLGAPHWNPHARGVIRGITRGTTKAHLARAALEGIAFQIADLAKSMERDFGRRMRELRVDGGAAANNFLMQFQSDLLDRVLVRPTMVESTALGAAMLAGLGAGIWPNQKAILRAWRADRRFTPAMKPAERKARLSTWHDAVECA